MAEIHFYLRDKKAEKTTIYASVSYDGFRVRISTNLKVFSCNWNSSKQRMRELMESPHSSAINKELEQIRMNLLKTYDTYSIEGIILSPEEFKKEFLAVSNSPILIKKLNSFWSLFDDFVEVKRTQLSDVRDYDKSLRKHLKATESKMNRGLSFRLIRESSDLFAENWERYLMYEALNSKGENGLSINTVGKQNKNLKVFLNWCFEYGHSQRFSLKKFPTLMEEVDNIYLKEQELNDLHAITGLSVLEQNVRDLFLIGCETGLRFSDFISIKPSHISQGMLTFYPKKTAGFKNNKIIIPLSSRFKEIYERNDFNFPELSKIPVTTFNKIIREVCRKSKIDEKIAYHRSVAGKIVVENRFRYQEVSSHTCRRTFCTLKFLKGMPAQAIMKFSGHKTERNFLKYLKLDAELTAKKYGEYF